MDINVKELIVKPIDAKAAKEYVKRNHYSGKVVPNSQINLGVFHNDRLYGVLQYGPSMTKRLIQPLVEGTGWNEFIELNRMVFSNALPRNSESRCIAISLKLIKKHYPHIKWVISFADGCQCGDGTIYRASGFVLTGIKKNTGLRVNPDTGEVMQQMQAHHLMIRQEFNKWKPLEGYQFRYIYFIDKSYRDKLTVPVIPFSKIDELGVGMYKGEKRSKQAMAGSTSTATVQR